jgi:hypothetical protein
MELKLYWKPFCFRPKSRSTQGTARAAGRRRRAWRRGQAVQENQGGRHRRALEELQKDHEAAQRSYRLACVAGAWQFASQPEFAPWIIALVGVQGASAAAVAAGVGNAGHHRLSPAADARGNRANSRRGRGRRHANAAGARAGRAGGPGGSDRAPHDLRHHAGVSWSILDCAAWRICRPPMNCAAFP